MKRGGRTIAARLGTRMAAVVLIMGALGYTAWRGASSFSRQVREMVSADEAERALQACRRLESDLLRDGAAVGDSFSSALAALRGSVGALDAVGERGALDEMLAAVDGGVAAYETASGAVLTAQTVEERERAFAALTAAGEAAGGRLRDLTQKQSEDMQALAQRQTRAAVLLSLWGAVSTILIVLMETAALTRPVRVALVDLARLATGDLSRDVSASLRQRRDELGSLGNAMQQVTGSLRQALREVAEGVETVAAASTQMSAISTHMAELSHQTGERAASVASSAEELGANVVSVASGMQQATGNLATVATATEQMSATIGEIAANSEKARSISAEATRQTQEVAGVMKQLGQAALEVGKVTDTITSISSQTNLLALNATIEAARAGAAGKGFAVVANEIKELALQTATASGEIRRRIQNIQASTSSAVADVNRIALVIGDVGNLIGSIATAIEEQSAVTKDMARSIVEASEGVMDANGRVSQAAEVVRAVAHDITGVDTASAQITDSSGQVQASSAELSRLAEQLRSMVARFSV